MCTNIQNTCDVIDAKCHIKLLFTNFNKLTKNIKITDQCEVCSIWFTHCAVCTVLDYPISCTEHFSVKVGLFVNSLFRRIFLQFRITRKHYLVSTKIAVVPFWLLANARGDRLEARLLPKSHRISSPLFLTAWHGSCSDDCVGSFGKSERERGIFCNLLLL